MYVDLHAVCLIWYILVFILEFVCFMSELM